MSNVSSSFAVLAGSPLIQMANDVLNHHHRTIHDHPKIQRAERKQVRGNIFQIETRCREQQRKRDGKRDNDRAANIAQKQEQDDDDQNRCLPSGCAARYEW